jgi:hypothetical protein
MSLSTKLNLMKLKSNINQPHHPNHNSPTSLSTSTSNPIFTFKNDNSDEGSSISISSLSRPSNETSDLLLNDSSSPTSDYLRNFSLTSSTSTSLLEQSELGSGKKNTSINTSNNNIATTPKRKKNLGAYDSNEEDSPESSGDEYVHTGFNDEDNKIVET